MKIKQLTSFPIPNELGLGNTNETYIRVENSLDVSDMFPVDTEVSIVDANNDQQKYIVKSKKASTEFRINQMGQLYRDYNVCPGDEIKFTYIEEPSRKTIFFSVVYHNRVFLSVGTKGTEIVNVDKLADFLTATSNKEYNIPISEGVLLLKYDKSEKKRSDSPNETDYYISQVNGVAISKGIYYITLNSGDNVLEQVQKNIVEEYIVPESLYTSRESFISEQPIQQIYYGAPGTGKSYEINKLTKGEAVVRTTFHPDSDYSTFVGAYKPIEEEVDVRTVPVVIGSGFTTFDQNKGTYKEKRITYKFVKQAFLKAYLGAWRKYGESQMTKLPTPPKKQFLIIEEINRGNCAQIFGDLFQLLDREDNGFSSYPIEAEADIQKEIARCFAEDEDYMLPDNINLDGAVEDYTSNYGATLAEDIINGRILLLPPNLYIWATMNTSDQSLFPIDSAFKRRWANKYIPIDPYKEEWYIFVGNYRYSWSSFLVKINKEIKDITSSEDKQLGFYFCKAKGKVISADLFVSKVLFYIYNDVFKDYGLSCEFFKDKENKEEVNKIISFQSLFHTDGKVKESEVIKLLNNLGLEPMTIDEESADDEIVSEDVLVSSTDTDSRRILHVEFADGTIIQIKRFPQYLEVLKKIGLDKAEIVASEKTVDVLGCALVSKEPESAIETSHDFSYVESDGYYVIKGIKGKVMLNFIPLVSEKFDLHLKVEYK